MYIGNNIRFLRRSKGLTQGDLANKLNKHSVSISDYEKGKSTPPIEVALQLCEIFAVDLNSLVTKDLVREGVAHAQVQEKKEPYQLEKDLKQQYALLQRLSKLQEQRLAELEREIREHAPELAERLGLE